MCDPLLQGAATLRHDTGHFGLHPEIHQDPLPLLDVLGAPGLSARGVETGVLGGAVRILGPAHHAEAEIYEL